MYSHSQVVSTSTFYTISKTGMSNTWRNTRRRNYCHCVSVPHYYQQSGNRNHCISVASLLGSRGVHLDTSEPKIYPQNILLVLFRYISACQSYPGSFRKLKRLKKSGYIWDFLGRSEASIAGSWGIFFSFLFLCLRFLWASLLLLSISNWPVSRAPHHH